MTHCGKHDIHFPEGGSCWCCDEQAMSPEERKKNYSNPSFLAKRGGVGLHQNAAANSTMQLLSQLSPEQLGNLLALAGKQKEESNRRVIA